MTDIRNERIDSLQSSDNRLFIRALSASVAAAGSLDLPTNLGGGAYQGLMIVSSTAEGGSNTRTHRTYSVFGRGTDSSFQVIHTDDGTSGGMAFSVATPTNGVIRVTNNHPSLTAVITVQFFGGFSF